MATEERTVISLRIDENKKALIDEAAKIRGLSRTDFMISTAYREAVDAVLDQRIFHLDKKTFEAFEKMMNAPVKYNKKLQELMNRKTYWE